MNDPGPQRSAILQAFRWLRAHWLLFCLTSLALLTPSFWRYEIYAADFGSHLYNAWLTKEVERLHLPGLHVVPQYTNILFDLLLGKLMPRLPSASSSLTWTERAAIAPCVLIFFWGAFSLASAAARRAAWTIAVLLAMFTYGVIFHWGFFNFYLSVGLSLFGLALVVAGSTRELFLLPIFLVLSAMAHPMGAACLVALGLYLAALRWLPRSYHLKVTIALLVFSFVVRWVLVRHFEVLPREITQYWLLGADQLYVYGREYLWIAGAAFVLCAVVVIINLRHQAGSSWLQIYMTIALVVCFAPGGLNSPESFGMMGYLPDRGSLYSAVALCVLVASCRPRPWFPIACALVAVPFFVLLYRDSGVLARRYQEVGVLTTNHLVVRVISMVPPVSGWRVHEDHSVDRACIGHCYSYNNYEPSTGQFRLHVDRDNSFVLVDDDALDAIKDGDYTVQTRDLPLHEVYQCGPKPEDLCIARLREGQKNGEVPNLAAP